MQWIVLLKLLLLVMCVLYTLVTMCGGNPLNGAYGFRYWRDPGPIVGNTALTQLQAFLAALLVPHLPSQDQTCSQ